MKETRIERNKYILYRGQWCYDSQDVSCGPVHWKDINHNCGGENQSPVNIDRTQIQRGQKLGDMVFQGYDIAPPGRWRLMNDGHSVLVRLEEETVMGYINISGAGLPNTFQALQFHFHWGSSKGNGSEHTVDGKQYPMELHIVHLNAKYRSITDAKKDPHGLAVLGFLVTVAEADNPNYNTILAGLKNVPNEGNFVDLASTFRLDSLLPGMDKLSRYYRYQGSLTTPDCAESVIWTLFEDPIPISRAQLRVFVDTVYFTAASERSVKMINNFRPPQPLKSRKVYASKDATISHSAPVRVGLPASLYLLLIAQVLHHL
ncbi:carbonic anhydrase 15-like isoform X2 [Rhinatrema bivittatum]|uniref:carbonic anhydrase 15-like isoform X2 n=1 Tax=Rhinatrema bivittatum TaxID=194408 RepID=UPI001125C004|nr:carbonic anhydrase 15-like isoform X2 [Rhinatrema bivittatum]XP_029427482.1 carbonic anhydrase 15-like isoform X2 [Rhinatrema bivittatum]XP_029427483.1 carbonic anhydrase 15-like isoform X2 [Rhinatrema bivittatum]